MASLSLPRVLQLKKNSLEAEREHFEKFQTLAIQKAINAIETPVKEKHVRSTIIGTFQEQSAITYWMVAIRLPLQDNRIVAWKFCHVTHKLLREGHPACLDDSQRHISMIENLGKLWVHLREGYGRLVHLYCNLLVCKLKFHSRNPRFPGNMQLTADELDAIAENDVNNYFQLCVELFDYMDEILTLQASVFDSLGNARGNSMTASGQCRLAALIPCAQDASHIYDCNVRLLFRLHASLPSDTLGGHRERFRQQFKKLSAFYKHASSLQYYRNLLTLPVLPANPPNFLQQSDFGTYVTPVVTIPEPQPDEVDAVGSLIDTSDTMSQMTPDHFEELDTRPTPSPQPDPVVERDRLIDHLQNELKRMRSEVSQLIQERNTMLGSMREHCTRLESQLQSTKSELEEEKQRADILTSQTPEIKKKLAATEDKVKVTDEKFQKLKGAYTQLREEHISLIRQKAEVDKMSANLRATAAQHESAKTALQQQLNDRIKDVELLQQSASSSDEIEAYKNEILSIRTDLEQARQKEVELEAVRASMEALEIEHKTATVEQQEKLTTIVNELKEATDNLEKVKQEREEKEAELASVREELVTLKERSGDEYKKVVEEKETALKQVNELTQQYLLEKQEQANYINSLKENLESLEQKLLKTETSWTKQCEKLNNELAAKSEELNQTLGTRDGETQKALDKLVDLQQEIDSSTTSYKAQIEEKSLEVIRLQAMVNEMVELKNDNESSLIQLAAEMEAIKLNLDQVINEKNQVETMLSEKNNIGLAEILEYHDKIEELKTIKDKEISNLNENLQENIKTLDELNMMVKETSDLSDRQKSECETLHQKIAELESVIDTKNKELIEFGSKLNDAVSNLEQQKQYYENLFKENSYVIELSKDKLHNVTECKDEIISNLKSMVAEKDEQVIALNIEVTKHSEEASRLAEELMETKAELEIGMNELMTLRDEHDSIVDRNESNLILKNQELRDLYDEIKKINIEKADIISEKQRLANEFSIEKEVLENNIKEITDMHSELTLEYNSYKNEHEVTIAEISMLKTDIDNLKTENETLTIRLKDEETTKSIELANKDKIIAEVEFNINQLKIELDELKMLNLKERENTDTLVSERDNKMQILDARLGHIESEKLNAECELQDLLQHNTILETDLAAAKIQLEEARQALKHKTSRLVQCAGEAALEVTNGALAALDRANAQDTNQATAELAAKAFLELGKNIEITGNEETLAKSAISVAHSTAQLSAYINDLSNLSTDMELADKLNTECRTMLTSTKQCLDSVKNGVVDSGLCTEARARTASAAQAAAAADRIAVSARSVDDELADMDQAIALAAEQIEEMLAASRAGDSGMKLEVNGKILDACTTLMGAVKILVQDARRLQQELGDTKTRLKMYRKNPQWSEGLISAAKSVVFAAKLLVTSADEAVGAAGRVEGVSAAAHEVAGSTAQLVAASRARAPPAAPALARLTRASRSVAAATGALVAAVRAASALVHDQQALDTSALSLTATRRLEMESKVRALELESALDAERARLAALRKRHYHLAQVHENGSMTNGKEQ